VKLICAAVWWARTVADLNLGVANMRQHLSEIARIKQRPADRTIAQMICFGFGDAVGIEAAAVAAPAWEGAARSIARAMSMMDFGP
jgi:hypothetical protein